MLDGPISHRCPAVQGSNAALRQRDVAGGSSTIYRASSRITKLSGIIGGQGQYQAGAASVGARPPAAGDGHQPQPDVSLREERDTETLGARSSRLEWRAAPIPSTPSFTAGGRACDEAA